MHLRQSDEIVRYAGVVEAGAGRPTDGHVKDQAEVQSSERQNNNEANEIEISIPEQLQREEVYSAIFAGWILFLRRYHRDSLEHFGWSRNEKREFHTVPLGELDVLNLQTISDYLAAARRIRCEDALVESIESPFLSIRDGTEDEVCEHQSRKTPQRLTYRSGRSR